MTMPVQVQLLPLGRTVALERGASLRDALVPHGVEFPCGGQGICRGCRIRRMAGMLRETPEDLRLLSQRERDAGWRLACRAVVEGDLTLELAQWDAAVLSDDTPIAFTPRPGFGVAVDLGTTTIVAQLIDLERGVVRAVRTALNAQAAHGSDVMSRIAYALDAGNGGPLTRQIREQVGGMLTALIGTIPSSGTELTEVVLVGNTVMHHLFCGLDVESLSQLPFEPVDGGAQRFDAAQLGWSLPGRTRVRFLPCLGGFVGSDTLAGILATGLHRADSLTALVDLGTNGEMVVGHGGRMLCASTAAGPAFEGARITQGMRAVTGAISEVNLVDGRVQARVLGGGIPRGLCGSGLVDAVAMGLDLGRIDPTGRLDLGGPLEIVSGIAVQQADIRELQLAKGAIAAGLRRLIEAWGAEPGDLTRLHLAGAFGNYIRRTSARRIGLWDYPPDRVNPVGNAALRGAKLALFDADDAADDFSGIRSRIRHLSLGEDPRFGELFADAMAFPPRPDPSPSEPGTLSVPIVADGTANGTGGRG